MLGNRGKEIEKELWHGDYHIEKVYVRVCPYVCLSVCLYV